MSTLGAELRSLREALGLTQEQVANKIGHAKPSRVSLWESDDERPGKANLAKLAAVLKTTVVHLHQFGRAYSPSAPRTTKRQRSNLPPIATEDSYRHVARHSPTIARQPQQDLSRESEAIVFRSLTLRSLETVVRLARTVEAHRDQEVEVCAAVEDVLARYDRPKGKAAGDA